MKNHKEETRAKISTLIQRLARSKLLSKRAIAGDYVRSMLADSNYKYDPDLGYITDSNRKAVKEVSETTGLSERKIKMIISDSIWYHSRVKKEPANRWMQSVLEMKKDGII